LATTATSAVRFSRGLRGLLGMTEAKTDQKLAEEEVGCDAGLYLGTMHGHGTPLCEAMRWVPRSGPTPSAVVLPAGVQR
jgi:hypothetical protein